MELYERIDMVVEKKAGSRAALAALLGVPQTTFNGYFSKERQHLFKVEHLERIFASYPDVNPGWLLSGQGEMLTSLRQDQASTTSELGAELADTRREFEAAKASPEVIQQAMLAVIKTRGEPPTQDQNPTSGEAAGIVATGYASHDSKPQGPSKRRAREQGEGSDL